MLHLSARPTWCTARRWIGDSPFCTERQVTLDSQIDLSNVSEEKPFSSAYFIGWNAAVLCQSLSLGSSNWLSASFAAWQFAMWTIWHFHAQGCHITCNKLAHDAWDGQEINTAAVVHLRTRRKVQKLSFYNIKSDKRAIAEPKDEHFSITPRSSIIAAWNHKADLSLWEFFDSSLKACNSWTSKPFLANSCAIRLWRSHQSYACALHIRSFDIWEKFLSWSHGQRTRIRLCAENHRGS